jgi:hypothetical protein
MSDDKRSRIETDTFGPIEVPAEGYWGAQTQRSLQNFKIGSETKPPSLVRALGIVKQAAARANVELGVLEPRLADAIGRAAQEVIDGKLADHFPLVVWQTGSGTRSADFIPGHLRAFGGATNDSFWMQSVDAIYGLIAKIQMVNSPTTGLLPDFVMNLNTNGVPASANWSGAGNPNDGQYFYHAARAPLRLVADYISSGGSEARAKTALAKMNTWIRMKTMDNPAMIIDGYNIGTGANIGNGPTVVFEGPFGAAAVVDAANQAWVDAIWNRISAGAVGNDSLAESIRLMSLLVMSGHWWAP